MRKENDATNPSELHAGLEQVRLRFETWRRRREKRTRIPDSLWEAAVELSGRYSVGCVSKALRVNHTALKSRIRRMKPEAPVSATFFELPLFAANATSQCTVEISRGDGAVMRMRFEGGDGSQPVELGKAFWSRGS